MTPKPIARFIIPCLLVFISWGTLLAQPYTPTVKYPLANGLSKGVAVTPFFKIVQNASYVEYQLDSISSFTNPIFLDTTSSDSFSANISLKYNKTYYLRLRSVDSVGLKSNWTNSYPFRTVDTVTVRPPLSLTYAQSAFSYFDFSNAPYSSLGSYVHIQIDRDPTFTSPAIRNIITSEKGVHLAVFRVDFKNPYYIRTRLLNENDTGRWSNGFYYQPLFPTLKIREGAHPTFEVRRTVAEKLSDPETFYEIETAKDQQFTQIIHKHILCDTLTKISRSAVILYRDTLFAYLFDSIYYCRVRAISVQDTSSWSFNAHFNASSKPYYYTPNNQHSFRNSTDTVELEWESQSGLISEIEMDTNEGFSSDLLKKYWLKETGSLKTLLKTTQLFYNTKYYFRHRRISSVDTSAWYLSTITSGNGPSFYYLSYDKGVSPWIGYIYIEAGSLVQTQLDTTLEFNSSMLRDTLQNLRIQANLRFPMLDYGTVYRLRIRAINNLDTSEWSMPDSLMTPAFPTAILPKDSIQKLNIDTSSFRILHIIGSNSYDLRLSTDSNFTTPVEIHIVPDQLGNIAIPFQTLNITHGTRYYWQTRAMHAFDTSSWSTRSTFTTVGEFSIPIQVSPPDSSIDHDTAIYFSWKKDKEAIGYELLVYSPYDTVSSTPIIRKALVDTTLEIASFIPGLTYFWKVRAMNIDSLYGDFSSTWTFTVASAATVNSTQRVMPLIFPNPTNSTLNILTEDATANNLELIIYNEQGICIRKDELLKGNRKIDVGSLAPGKYYLSILNNSKRQMFSFIIIR